MRMAPAARGPSEAPPFAIIEAPSVLGLKPTGVDQLPAALRRHGLVERLGARVAASLAPPPYDAARPPDTGTLNADGIARFSRRAGRRGRRRPGRRASARSSSAATARSCSAACSPSGGAAATACCSSTATPTSTSPRRTRTARRRRWTWPSRPAADRRRWPTSTGCGPLVRDEDVVAFGFRDHDEQRAYGSQPLAAGHPRHRSAAQSAASGSKRRGAGDARISRAPTSTASSSTSTPTCSTTRSCRPSTIGSPAASTAAELIHVLRAVGRQRPPRRPRGDDLQPRAGRRRRGRARPGRRARRRARRGRSSGRR